jgi:hypothetical protein
MIRNCLSGAFIALFVLLGQPGVTLFAQSLNSQDAKKHAVLAELEKSIVRVVGTEGQTIEVADVTTAENILTVSRINSTINEAAHADRTIEANLIASIVSKAILGKPEFKNLIAIHVKYMTRSATGGHDKVIDAVEFRRDFKGEFPFHGT